MWKITLFSLSLIALAMQANADNSFSEKHFGFEFKYGEEVAIKSNPHAMRKIPIYYDSIYAGGLVVSVFPEGLTEKQFMEYGSARYKSEYGNNSVQFIIKENAHGCEYYHFVVNAKNNGKPMTIERAIFIKQRESGIKKEGIKVTYTFNYKYSEDEQKKALRKLVDSFKLIPNEAIYNDALYISIKK